jgi:hypothetical protein
VRVWNEVTRVSGLYCFYLSETLALIISQWLLGKIAITDVYEPDAPTLNEMVLSFFAHPPENLDKLREQVAKMDRSRPQRGIEGASTSLR